MELMTSEDRKVLNGWVSKYVELELSYPVRKQETKFYSYLLTQLSPTLVQGKTPTTQNKQIIAVLNKVAVSFKKGKNTTQSAHMVHDYFYHKFIDDIKRERLKRTGNQYSTKQTWEGRE